MRGIAYQWQRSPDNADGVWKNIGGATGTTYQPPAVGLGTEDTYYRIVTTNTSGNSYS